MKSFKLILPAVFLTLALCFDAGAQQKPNIIWIMAEDIGPDLECYGMPDVKTPNLNALASEGIKYAKCFTTNPICSPSRSAMMTGVYQNSINAGQHRSNHDVPLPEPYKPFTYWLRQAGYTTVLGSKLVMNKGRKIDVNFKNAPLGKWDGKKNFGLFDKYDEISADNQPFFAQIQLAVTHRGDWWDSIRSISPHRVDPSRVTLPSYLADDPIVRLDWATYLDQIEYMDAEVGKLVADLKQKGVYDNTVLIFIGDNGRCNIRGKGYLYDIGVHVPLIVHWPKGIKAGQVKQDLVSAIDITATILDLAGVQAPAYMEGKSFLKKGFHRDYIYSARDRWDEVSDKSRALTTQQYKYIRNDMPEVSYDMHQAYIDFYRPPLHVMRKLNLDGKLTDAQKLFFARVKPVEELYDLEKDPEEIHNLADDPKYSAVLAKLRADLAKEEKKDTAPVKIQYAAPSQAPVIMDWVRYNYPQDYLQMLQGKEIGYQKFERMYRLSHK
ncbi:MAG TPA: sulfatase [Chryseosolibacter sp.]|nr:sulfatase [Chryseosolibacter sp.]